MRVVVSVVVVDGGMDGGGGKEPLSFVDGAKLSVGVCRCSTKSGVTVGMYSRAMRGYRLLICIVY